jgi:hypothetical protein
VNKDIIENQTLRLKIQMTTLENEKLRERVIALEQELSEIKREAMRKFESGWGKGKDE